MASGTFLRPSDHILEASGFNEQVLAVPEHLVMNQRMRTPETLAEVIDRSTNLRQLDLALAPERIQDVGFGEVAERQASVGGVGEIQ
jgi:hypothetical protein